MSNSPNQASEFMEATYAYWRSMLAGYDDLPDGAWWCVLEETFSQENIYVAADLCEVNPIECDPNTMAHAYCEQLAIKLQTHEDTLI